MKSIRLFLILASCLIYQFNQAQYVLTIHFDLMEDYTGFDLGIRVTEIGSGKEVARKSIPLVAQSFSTELYVLLNSKSYQVDLYVDVNQNDAYDSPPMDHVWRREIINATENTEIHFVPDDNFTDTGWPDAFPYSRYEATWGGKWMNLTFGSTDSIEAGMTITCDSISLFLTTAGIFGIPTEMTFDYEAALTGDFDPGDTIHYTPNAPWTGDVAIINGELHGNISLMGVGLQFTGTFGAHQMLALYTVIVSGNPFASGYFYVIELSIEDSAPEVVISSTEIGYVTCAGESDGFIFVVPAGGTPGYSFEWSNGSTESYLGDIPAGLYSVTITDTTGCNVAGSFFIIEPPSMSMDILVTPTSCHNTCDAVLEVMVTGGSPPFDYTFPDSLCEGGYTIFVTDALGCQIDQEIFISSPPEIVVELVSINHAINGEAVGSITIEAFGGTGELLYSWNGGVFTHSPGIYKIPPGSYIVVVMDENGCITESEAFIVESVTGIKEPGFAFSLYPNPVISGITVSSDIPLSIEIFDIRGLMLAKVEASETHEIDMKQFAPGMYLFKIAAKEDCDFRKVIRE